MARKNRKGIVYPSGYMKKFKKEKRKKIRNLPLDKVVVEQRYNNAERQL